jgi:hypothetical protein
MRIIFPSLIGLAMLGCLATSCGEPSINHPNQGWRRTAKGWEHPQAWAPRIVPADPALHPSMVALFEVLLVLSIAALSKQSDDWRIVRGASNLVARYRGKDHARIWIDSGNRGPRNGLPDRRRPTNRTAMHRRRSDQPLLSLAPDP